MMKGILFKKFFYLFYNFRAFTTTTTHIELKEALKCGYVVTHLYRALSWYSICGNLKIVLDIYRNIWSTNVFDNYVRELVKLKVENSKFPPSVCSIVEKKRW